MKKTKRITAIILALTLIFGTFAMAIPSVFAVSEATIYVTEFPRSADPNKANWGHGDLDLMSGWSSASITFFAAHALDGYTGKKVYCIEPSVPIRSGDTLSEKGESYWDDLPDLNSTIGGTEMKKLIGRILMYGYTGNVSVSWTSDDAVDSKKIGNMIATQYLIWETIVGERNADFSKKNPPSSKDKVLDMLHKNHPCHGDIMDNYNRIVQSVQEHTTIPSFCETTSGKAQTVELTWDGSKYTTTLNDSNGVLSQYTFSSNNSNVSFSRSGNRLTISSTVALTNTLTITAERNNSKRKGLIVWSDGHFGPGGASSGKLQDIVDYAAEVSDPVSGYLKVEVGTGSLEIIKTSQHNGGTVSGFQFEVRDSANKLIGTYTSTSSGKISVPNLNAGTYTVREINLSSDFVAPTPNPVTVEVKAGQTATVSFNNVKKRGIISLKKTDANPTMGGYSLAGAVFEVRDSGGTLVDTITTDSKGEAQTKILPLGTYSVKETKAPTGFVVDSKSYTSTISGAQGNAAVVYAPDVNIAEQPQVGRVNIEKYNSTPNLGDYDLSGAVFEIRNSSGTLVDTLTTDSQGKAQSKSLKLGDYRVSEKTAPNGYVRNADVFNVKLEYGSQTASVVYATAKIPERPQTGIVKVQKTNANMGDYNLSGAVFEVHAAQDIKQRNGTMIYAKGALADTITTNAAGEAQTKELPLGRWYFL